MTLAQGEARILQYTITNTAADPPAPLDLTGKTVVGYLGWTYAPQLVEYTVGDGIVLDSDLTTGKLTVTITGADTAQVSSRLGRAYRFELYVIGDSLPERVDAIAIAITDSWLVPLS